MFSQTLSWLLLTCGIALPPPNALDATGQKQKGHVMRAPPPLTERGRVNKGTARGLFICPITPILWAAARARATLRGRGGAENSGFSARLRNTTVSAAPPAFLPHPETTSKRLQRARRRGKREKKNTGLIAPVKNQQSRSLRVVFSYRAGAQKRP